MLAALKLFELSPMADGQESSTRYIELSPKGMIDISKLGFSSPELTELLETTALKGFETYSACLELLSQQVENNPSLAKIPEGTPEKTAQRMLKNYALDRARYFLPMCAKTNLALVMTARMWAETLRGLESLNWVETNKLASLIREELKIAAPDLIRHSFCDQASKTQTQLLHTHWEEINRNRLSMGNSFLQANTPCSCEVHAWQLPSPEWESKKTHLDVESSFEGKTNRYSTLGTGIKRLTVCSRWSAMALAEIRDLNRHRTGFRLTHFLPQGFYLPKEIEELKLSSSQNKLIEEFLHLYKKTLSLALEKEPQFAYTSFLGTQLPFEHTQQGDKFVYEVELRTGLGAHFRYAEHLKDAAELFFTQIPEAKSHIHIGDAEPE
jgi:hypothetical protein